MNQLFALSLGIAAMAFAANQAQPLSPAPSAPFGAVGAKHLSRP